ncbi:hypothetical protein D3C79_680240 [compost metagenome]
MHAEGRLHLEAGDVFSTASQIVLFAVDKVEEAVMIELADVASMEPHVAHQLLGVFRPAPVALEHDVRAQWAYHDFTGGIRGYFLVKVVDNAYIEVGNTFARGAGRCIFAGCQRGDHAGFGQAIAVATHQRRAEAFAPDLLGFFGIGVAASGVYLPDAAQHGLVVWRLCEEPAHAAENRGDSGARAFHFRPEAGHRKARQDGGTCTHQNAGDDRHAQGIHVE